MARGADLAGVLANALDCPAGVASNRSMAYDKKSNDADDDRALELLMAPKFN